jgi:hypothetical protein
VTGGPDEQMLRAPRRGPGRCSARDARVMSWRPASRTPRPARLKQVLTSLVHHLHAFAEGVELTGRNGRGPSTSRPDRTRYDDVRQEFILLSDVPGVSMLVQTINRRTGGTATESTGLGPSTCSCCRLVNRGRTSPSTEGTAVPGHRPGDVAGRRTGFRALAATARHPTVWPTCTSSPPPATTHLLVDDCP